MTDKDLITKMDDAIWEIISQVHTAYKDDEAVAFLAPLVEPDSPGMFDPRLALGGMGSITVKNGPPFLNAPAVVIVAGDTRSIGGPDINIGICGQNMNLVANSLGIKSCWVGFVGVLENIPGFVQENLGIEPPWQIKTSLVLGWPEFKQEGIVPREFRPVTWYRSGGKPEIED